MSKKSLTKELAMGSILTGQISEVHIKNMKMYPFIFLDDVSQAEIAYDIITDTINVTPGKKSTVSYTLGFKGTKPSKEVLKPGFDNLQKALSVLFSQKITLILRDQSGQDLMERE
jgi:uncharacterized lipoprotein YajG